MTGEMSISPVICRVRMKYDRWDAHITSHVWTWIDTWLLTCPCQWSDWRSEGIMTGEMPISPVMFEHELTHDCWHAHVSGRIKGQKELCQVRRRYHQSCLNTNSHMTADMRMSVVGLKVRRNHDRWDAHITSHGWTRIDTWLLTCPCQWSDQRSEGIMTGEMPISPVMFELELTHDCWHAHVKWSD